MINNIDEKDWDTLLGRIKAGKCTPILGAGACYDFLPLGSDIAKDWAKEHKYPFKDSYKDLTRVAQFLAVERDGMYPKEQIVEIFRKKFQESNQPNYEEVDEPHGLLADFRLPIYITTNYDSFMIQALKSRKCEPKQELCRWNSLIKKKSSVFDDHKYSPSRDCPVVFHLHGYLEVPESLVLTEEDYLDFLVNISKNFKIIPSTIQASLASTSLLFIGYKLADIDFRVLLKGIIGNLESNLSRSHISVQLIPLEEPISREEKDKAEDYLNRYFKQLNIKVYWGTSREFTKELRNRWEKFKR